MVDKFFHDAYNADVKYTKAKDRRIHCFKCGAPLELYYCENRLYAIKCRCCEMVTLVMANNPLDAFCKVGWYNRSDAERFDPYNPWRWR